MFRFYIVLVILLGSLLYSYGCDFLISNQSKPDVPPDHNKSIGGFYHASGERQASGCADCHGKDLRGGTRILNGRYIFAQSCYQCHGKLWDTGNGNK